ncbi:MAG TPA: FG-GAP-like repeat-containing protein [Candidatus Acidoferrales bacterium]|nr:FG-GAP-like repeat-containing protein [Candidatus Acidoferrales bacterium]
MALACAAALAGVPAAAQSSAPDQGSSSAQNAMPDVRKSWHALQEGLRAERHGDWGAAFDSYKLAAAYAPDDTDILRHREEARFRVVSQLAEKAERSALAGQLNEAIGDLREALQLDPGYSVAQERLAQFSALAAEQAPKKESPPASLPRLEPQRGARSFELRGDTHTAYEEVARQFGLAASFDGDLASRPVHLKLTDVDFETAARILALETRTFWRPLNAHLFFVADDNPTKRRDYAPVVEQSIELPASATPEQMTEVLRMIREIAGVTRIQLDTARHSLTLRDSPLNVELAAELVRQVEQPRGEVMLEIEILEVDRNAALRFGITPPSTGKIFSINPQDLTALQKAPDIATLIAILQRIFGSSGTLNGLSTTQLASLIGAGQVNLGALIPPLVAFGGGRTTLLATLPGAAADFSETFSLIRHGQRMLLRAEDGLPATFFVGDRFPVALSLLSASLGSSQFTPIVSAGAFPRSDFPVGKGPNALTAGDFNGDAHPDLAVVNGGDGTLTILLNTGSGSFTPANGSPIAFPRNELGPDAISAADFNGDGHLDLAVANFTSNNVTILLGNGDGTFTEAAGSPIAAGNGPTGIATGDFDGDGHADFAVTNTADNTVSIFLGNGKGGFAAAKGSPIALSSGASGPSAIVAGDFNGDGRLDLAVTNKTSNNVTVLLGNGNGTFTEAAGSPFAVGVAPVALTTTDFDGDGHLDLAIANSGDNTASIFLGRGDGTFVGATGSPLATGTAPFAVASADFNVDGRADLAVANSGDNTVSIFLGIGGGAFIPQFTLPTGSFPAALATADLNGDGRADLVIADEVSDQVSVILNPSAFAPPTTGIAQQPYPGSEYIDLGLKVKATPRVHPNDEVSLLLQIEITSLSGTAINGIPIISNRSVEQSVRLRENETTLLSGMLERDEIKAITGLPGLAPLPVFGQAAGRRDSTPRETELLILVTPRRLRMIPHYGRPIYVGRGAGPASSGAAVAEPGEPRP